MQSELAEANSVAEEALSSMSTVRAFAAEDSARAAYQHRLCGFYTLQVCVRPAQSDYDIGGGDHISISLDDNNARSELVVMRLLQRIVDTSAR